MLAVMASEALADEPGLKSVEPQIKHSLTIGLSYIIESARAGTRQLTAGVLSDVTDEWLIVEQTLTAESSTRPSPETSDSAGEDTADEVSPPRLTDRIWIPRDSIISIRSRTARMGKAVLNIDFDAATEPQKIPSLAEMRSILEVMVSIDSLPQYGQPADADPQVIPAAGLQEAEQPPAESSSREPRSVPVRIDAHPRGLLEGRLCLVHLKPVETNIWSRRFTTYEGKVLSATDEMLELKAHTHRVSIVSMPSLIAQIPWLARLFKNTGVGQEPIDEARSIPLESISSIEVLPLDSRSQTGQ